jgi:hypothetical protein
MSKFELFGNKKAPCTGRQLTRRKPDSFALRFRFIDFHTVKLRRVEWMRELNWFDLNFSPFVQPRIKTAHINRVAFAYYSDCAPTSHHDLRLELFQANRGPIAMRHGAV